MTFLNSNGNRIKRVIHFKDISLVEGSGDVYRTTNTDPQLEFDFKQPLAPGCYEFGCAFTLYEGQVAQSKVYFDTGSGYNEAESMVLVPTEGKSIQVFVAPKSIYKIRFDFTEDAGLVFQFHEIAVRRLSKVQLYQKLYSLQAGANSQYGGLKKYLKTAALLLSKPESEIADLLNGTVWSPLNYSKWIDRYDRNDATTLNDFSKQQHAFAYRPLISIILPVYNTPETWLTACIQSVLAQVYTHWELCITDDHSTAPHVRACILSYAAKDSRIKYEFRNTNGGIAACSNTALSLATGTYVTFLDHDDLLAPLALCRIAAALNDNAALDFIYTDEDKVDETGVRREPFFKPEWSPALFYCQNYIAHLACIRKRLVDAVGGFTEGVEGSQDYDLYLKVLQKKPVIQHLPFVLYHWRRHPASTAMQGNAKSYAHAAGRKALEHFLSKKYPQQFESVQDGGHVFTYKPRFRFDATNKISIIIPTKDKIEYLEPCINSIIEKSTWANYEILILNNNSVEEKTYGYLKKIQAQEPRVRVIDALFEFNWSKLNNFGTRHASGNYLIFLNNDMTVITPSWMQDLCAWASLPDVATVGATLLYEDDTIQHAGVVLGMNGWADHVFKNMPPQYFSTPYISNNMPRNVLAVTGACTAIERKKFEQLGLFDENFIICGSDVELGIRAHKAGLFNVLDAYVQLYHFESKSRGTAVPENDFAQSALKYEPYRTQQCDPFYNPNLSLNHTAPVCKL